MIKIIYENDNNSLTCKNNNITNSFCVHTIASMLTLTDKSVIPRGLPHLQAR